LRQIGTLSKEDAARILADHLLTLGVTTQLRKEDAGWGLWVLDEDRIPVALKELEAFRENPADRRFQAAPVAADTIRREADRRDQEYRKNFRVVTETWNSPNLHRRPLTFALIVVCSAVFLLMRLPGWEGRVTRTLAFSVDHFEIINKDLVRRPGGVDDIVHGEVWRLVTPIFLHFGILHLLFNMWALAFLGSIIEYRRGSLTLALLVLLSAMVSNLGQYLYEANFFESVHLFGGMSGVVYALFGYIWMKGQNEPEQGMILHPSTVQTMLFWLVICMMGWIPNIANAAHLVGVGVGIVCGLAQL
jgi:GlpG protein